MIHEWYHSPQRKHIYHNESNIISKYFYNEINHSKVRLNMDSKEKEENLPSGATSIIITNNIDFITQDKFIYMLSTSCITNQFREYISQLLEWQRILIRNYQNNNIERRNHNKQYNDKYKNNNIGTVRNIYDNHTIEETKQQKTIQEE